VEKSKSGKIFYYNPLNLLPPSLILLTAWVIASQVSNLKILFYVLLAVSLLWLLYTLTGVMILVITESQVGLRRLWKERVIALDEITAKHRQTIFLRGSESITWKLFLKNGKVVIIQSDSFRAASRLKEALNWFLRDVPKK
jgi:hypothetical protein